MSRPRVGCAAISTVGSKASSRASSAFCRLPPDSVPARAIGPGQRMSKALICSSAKARMAPGLSRPLRLNAAVADARQHHAVGERQRGHQPRRSCDPPGCGRRRAPCTRVGVNRETCLPASSCCRRSGASVPEITPASARWPLPETPAMPTISPARTARLRRRCSGVPAWPEVEMPCERQHGRALRRGAPRRRHDLVAAHQPRHLGGGRRGGVVDVAGDAAVAQHHAAMGQRAHLVELVRDEDDAEPLRGHGPQRREQAVDLGRRQHRGRLVEDQEPRAAKQRLDDLQPLLLADRQRRRPAGRDRASGRIRGSMSLEAAPARRRGRAGRPCRAMPTSRLSSTRQPRREMEMLVHHADAGGQRIGRAG